MSLIDATYFRGEINVAQRSQPAVVENLQYFITRYEADLLNRLLGLGFAEAFRAGILAEPTEQRWKDLRDGKVYTTSGETKQWMGFVNEQKLSIIANYVYYHYIRNDVTQTVGVGQVKSKAENAAVVSPAPKMSRSWNTMLPWIHQLQQFLEAHASDYPEWKRSEQELCYFSHINDFNL